MRAEKHLRFPLFLAGLAGMYACGGGDDDEVLPPPPPPTATVGFEVPAGDPCSAKIPVPSDLFRSDSQKSERGACTSSSDPVQAAIDSVLADEGAPVSASIDVPIVDGDLSIPSLTSSVPFSLTASAATPSGGSQIPGIVLFELTGTATASDGWGTIEQDPGYAGGTLVITPRRALLNSTRYVLVITNAVKDTKGNGLKAPEAIAALTANTPVGSIEGLDADTIAKLERERQRLAPLVEHLANAFPPIPAENIASIQQWVTSAGPSKVPAIVNEYKRALEAGRFPFTVTDSGGGIIQPTDVYPQGTPASFYDKVRGFHRGTISVPNLLDSEGRIRGDWSTKVETTEVPFLIAIPETTRMRYPVILYVPGYARSSQDAREIANEVSPQAAVLAIDLPFHGSRSTDTTDSEPNFNPEFAGPDGIPDTSGDGFFPGSPGVLRDSLIANVIEIVHVLETLKDRTAFDQRLINPDGSVSNLHLVAQGHAAFPALFAANASAVNTVQFPAGGAGITELVEQGPQGLRDAFLASAPTGINEANLAEYLSRLEGSVLDTTSLVAAGETFKVRYVDRNPVKVLLAHGGLAQFVPTEARQRLIDALEIPSRNVSQHRGFCDAFFLHTCRQGDNFLWVQRAREQISAFVSSGGQTIRPPAN